MKILTFGFLHFFFQRYTVILSFCLCLMLLFLNLTFINILISLTLIFHLYIGFLSLMDDYLHVKNIKIIFILILDSVFILLCKTVYLVGIYF
jgi:hypothetical protein